MIKKVLAWLRYLFISADPYLLYPVITTLLTITVLTTIFLVLYSTLPPKLPLLYSHPWGEKELVVKSQFLILPTIAALVTLINSLFAWQIHGSHLVLKRILLLSVVLVDLLVLITGLKILYIFI